MSEVAPPRVDDEEEPSPEDIQALSAPTDAEDDDEVTELPDGSAFIKAKTKPAKPKSKNWDANLAETMDEGDLNKIGIDLCERVENDKMERKERDKQYAEGIKRTGLGNDAPGGAEFDGSSKVVHPMLAKGCVDFASKAIKELYPASGPCKTQIIGKTTERKLSKAERKKTFMNWQLMTRVAENRAEFERLLSQVPLGGAQYKRWWHDPRKKRLRTEAVFIDDVFLPYNCNDFYTSHRVTHRQYVSKAEFEDRIDSGLYREIDLASHNQNIQDKAEARAASEKVEGVEEEASAYNDEGLREIYMIYADLALENEDEVRPYILHVDEYTHKVLGAYRNWDEGDETAEKKHWMVEYIFIPWRGPHGLGLAHLIGSLAAASTGALRAILDSAHINNFPGGLKLKGGRSAGQSVTVNATELQEIEAPAGVDDIRKLVMAFPFNGPSTVLYQLLEWLSAQGEAVVATANEKIAEGGANMPMGTALALIEQGSVNFSAIHSRMHASLKKELEIVHRLNKEYLSDREVVEDLGELVVSRADFEGPMDVIPVSDPNIFSEAQRYAQMQAVLQLSTDPRFAPLFPPDKLLRRVLKLLQVPDVDDITRLPKEPEDLSPIDENYASCAPEPQPLKVYDDQDDVSHLMAHTHFMTSPMFGANPILAPKALPALVAHCAEHLMSFYRKHAKAASEAMMTVAQAQGGKMSLEQAEAHGAAFADQIMAQALSPMIMPALAQAAAQAQKLVPPPQADPNEMLRAQTQKDVEQMKIDAQAASDEKDRAANQEATQVASAQEERATQSKEALATMQDHTKSMHLLFQTHVDAVMNQQAEQRKMDAQARADELQVITTLLTQQGQQQLLVLQNMLGVGGGGGGGGGSSEEGGAEPSAPEKLPDTKGVIAQLMQSMADNNQMLMQRLGEATASQAAMMGQLATGLQQLQAAQSAPRTAEFIRDEKTGKPKGIRSTVQ